MTEHAADRRESHEPLTPGNVFAHMLVALILLAGVWGIEWLKSRFEHGVPTLTAASIATGELAMLAYFVGALVRACKWAFSEFDDAINTIRKTRLMKGAKRGLSSLGPIMRDGIPSSREMLRASRFVVLFLVLGLGAVVIVVVLNISGSSPPNFNFSNANRNANNNSNGSVNSNKNANYVNGNGNSNLSHDKEPVPSFPLSALVWVFNHSGTIAIVASVVVGLTVLTFVGMQISRALAPE